MKKIILLIYISNNKSITFDVNIKIFEYAIETLINNELVLTNEQKEIILTYYLKYPFESRKSYEILQIAHSLGKDIKKLFPFSVISEYIKNKVPEHSSSNEFDVEIFEIMSKDENFDEIYNYFNNRYRSFIDINTGDPVLSSIMITNDYKIAQFYIDKGLKFNFVDRYNMNALLNKVILSRDYETTKFLIKNDYPLNIVEIDESFLEDYMYTKIDGNVFELLKVYDNFVDFVRINKYLLFSIGDQKTIDIIINTL